MRTILTAGAAFIMICAAGQAGAQSVMKQCSDAYQAAKAANSLNGETWPQYFSHCATEKKASASAASPAPVAPAAPSAPVVSAAAATAAPVAAPAPAKENNAAPDGAAKPAEVQDKPDPAAKTASPARSRQKECGNEWRANKAALKAQYGSWPKYWSACNLRLKSGGK